MGLSQEQVIALLQQHGVEFQQFQHAPVMTAEAQVYRCLLLGGWPLCCATAAAACTYTSTLTFFPAD